MKSKCGIIFNPTDPKHTKRKERQKARNVIDIDKLCDKIDDDIQKTYANIYCCGGSVSLNNFTSRLRN